MLTKEYIEGEIATLEGEKRKAEAFALQADGAIAAWKTALAKLEEVEGDGECAQST